MRVLITGIAGFVGSHLAKRLFAEGFEVHGVVRPTTKLGALADCPGIVLHQFDGTQKSLDAALACKPDAVAHLAAIFVSEHASVDIPRLIESNVLFGTMLLESMKSAGCRRIVNTGTGWQHYETSAYRPANLYAATKQAFEDILAYYIDAEYFSCITMMLGDTYGDDDTRGKLYSLLRKAAAEGSSITLSRGDQYVDFSHVDRVAEGFERAIRIVARSAPSSFHVYRVASGEPLPLKELVARWEKTWGKKASIVWGGRPYRKREVMNPWTAAEDIFSVDDGESR